MKDHEEREYGHPRDTAMRTLRKIIPISRRTFLTGSGAALVASLAPMEARAQSTRAALTSGFSHLGPDTSATLVQVARDIFPHDKLSDKYYVAAIQPYETQAASDDTLKTLIQGGVAQLDQAGRDKFKMAYADIPSEMDRISLLISIEDTPFFQRIRGDMVTSLYNNKDVWPFFGYEGPSWKKGGYLNRGFNDIDWL